VIDTVGFNEKQWLAGSYLPHARPAGSGPIPDAIRPGRAELVHRAQPVVPLTFGNGDGRRLGTRRTQILSAATNSSVTGEGSGTTVSESAPDWTQSSMSGNT
jgi:hypothetical protein